MSQCLNAAAAAAFLLLFVRDTACCSTGKLEVVPTKLMGTKEDLSVAYSPGAHVLCNMLHVLLLHYYVLGVLTMTSIQFNYRSMVLPSQSHGAYSPDACVSQLFEKQ
jgi:hypothetical protein